MTVLFKMIPNDSFIYDVIQWQFYLWWYPMVVLFMMTPNGSLFMMITNGSFIDDDTQW